MNQALFEFIKTSPTAFHAVSNIEERLIKNGYKKLNESSKWDIEAGKGYFVSRNGSSVIAFRIPEGSFDGFMITAAHADSPCLKIKENEGICDKAYVRLSTEKYGGMICSTWLDRPLSIAGRLTVRTKEGIETRLVDLKDPCALIPNVAIHMNRNINEGLAYNAAVDMIPLYGTDKNDFTERIAAAAGISKDDILTKDLYLYNPQAGVEWNGFISAPRLDDLQCAFAAFNGFLDAKVGKSIPVYCLFDNEEVGSTSRQGAASTFMADVLERICESLELGRSVYMQKISNSFLVSCDNAHAVHPNHPEYADGNHTVYMNKGIVIKYNANQKYTSDAVSSAIFKMICEEAGVPVQYYANRADMPGGSTLGNISATQVSLCSVDVGLAQLAMHSAYETAGASDTALMCRALKKCYEKAMVMKSDGVYALK